MTLDAITLLIIIIVSSRLSHSGLFIDTQHLRFGSIAFEREAFIAS